MEHEAVHADLLVALDADPLNQAFLVAYGGKGGHEPAVAVIALSDVVGGRAFDEETRFIEDVLRWAKTVSLARCSNAVGRCGLPQFS